MQKECEVAVLHHRGAVPAGTTAYSGTTRTGAPQPAGHAHNWSIPIAETVTYFSFKKSVNLVWGCGQQLRAMLTLCLLQGRPIWETPVGL